MPRSPPVAGAGSGEPIRNRLELVDGVKEGIGGVLVAHVDLHVGDTAVADVIVSAVERVERKLLLVAAGIAHRRRAATAMHLDDRVLAPRVDARGRVALRV